MKYILGYWGLSMILAESVTYVIDGIFWGWSPTADIPDWTLVIWIPMGVLSGIAGVSYGMRKDLDRR